MSEILDVPIWITIDDFRVTSEQRRTVCNGSGNREGIGVSHPMLGLEVRGLKNALRSRKVQSQLSLQFTNNPT